jgi:hypothetical protein
LRVRRGGIPVHDFLFPFRRGLDADLREKRRHAGQLISRPLVRTLTHERQRHRLRDAFRVAVLHGAIKIGLADLEIAAAGREQIAYELVVRLVLFDGGPNPVVIRLRCVGPQINGELRLHPQQVAPLHRPVIRKFIARQKLVNELGAFVRVAVQDEAAGFARRRLGANHVQAGAPDKHRVGTEIGRLDVQLFQPVENELVNFTFRRQFGRAFIRAGLRPGDNRSRQGSRQDKRWYYWCSHGVRRSCESVASPCVAVT